MSNKSRISRMVRDVEHRQNCNNILKSRGMPENYEIFNQLEKTHSEFEEKYAKLKKFTAKSKTAMKVQARVTEWIEEQNRLQHLAFKIETAVRGCFETAIVTAPDFTALHELLQSISDASKGRKNNENEIISQLAEVKQMLQEVKKVYAKNSGNPPSSSSAATSIIADLLLKIRTNHSDNWTLLKRQEEEYTRELNAVRSKILNGMRNDVLAEQDNQLRLELDTIVRSCSENSDVPQIDEFELDLVINEWYQKLSALDIEHESNMKCKEIEKFNYCQELGLFSEESNSENKEPSEIFRLGGWKSEDHEVFTKILKKAQVTGMLRKVMTDLMVSQLPHIPQEDILLHEEWYRKMRSIGNKYKENEQIYVTTRADMVQEAKHAVLAFRDAQREKWASDQQLQESEKYRQELHAKLNEMRLRKEELTAAQREAEEQRQAEEQARQAQERDLQQREQQQRKELLAQFHAAQAEQQRVDRERREKEQRERQEEIQRLIELNRPKVEMRAQLLAEKEQKQQQKEAELQAEEARRLALLQKLAEQVPYFEAIQNASSKLDHITASVKGHEYFKGEDLTRGHMPLNGFTDRRVISDSRFRLATALREAGVQGSEAAKMVVQQFCPRPHLAIHGII